MGLDITAYKNLTPVLNPKFDKYGYPENRKTEWMAGESMDWSESIWKGRGEGIDSKTVYTYEDKFEFRAGSYSGYYWWRSYLEKLSDGKSFIELIDFADNEGVIGSVVSNKLHNDFISNYDKAKEYSQTLGEGEEYWFSRYEDWLKAFEMAKENGAIDFH